MAIFLPVPYAEPFLLCSSGMFLLLIFTWHPPPFLSFTQPPICFAAAYHRIRLMEILGISLASFLIPQWFTVPGIVTDTQQAITNYIIDIIVFFHNFFVMTTKGVKASSRFFFGCLNFFSEILIQIFCC